MANFRWLDATTAVSEGHIVDRIAGVASSPPKEEQICTGELLASWIGLIRVDWSKPLDDIAPELLAILEHDSFWLPMCGSAIDHFDEQDGFRCQPRVIPERDFPLYLGWRTWILSGFKEEDSARDIKDFSNAHAVVADDRQFAVTEKGSLGWVLHDARVGDSVAVLAGGRVPYTLRKCEDTDEGAGDQLPRYTFLGDAYIHGIMDGETLDEEKGI